MGRAEVKRSVIACVCRAVADRLLLVCVCIITNKAVAVHRVILKYRQLFGVVTRAFRGITGMQRSRVILGDLHYSVGWLDIKFIFGRLVGVMDDHDLLLRT